MIKTIFKLLEMWYNIYMKKLSKGKIALIIIASIILFVIVSSFLICLITSNINYEKNKAYLEEMGFLGLIYNQSNFPDYKYGLGTLAKNGCGAASVYNILELEGKNPSLLDITKRFDLEGQNLFGILGTRILAVKHYLEREGYDVDVYRHDEDFNELAKNSKYAILYYVIPSRTIGHFQLMYDYNEYDGKYQMLDPYYRGTMQGEFDYIGSDFAITFLITVNDKVE